MMYDVGCGMYAPHEDHLAPHFYATEPTSCTSAKVLLAAV
jgi:hypothetical protein